MHASLGGGEGGRRKRCGGRVDVADFHLSLTDLGCRLPLMKGSSSLVEWCWDRGDVGSLCVRQVPLLANITTVFPQVSVEDENTCDESREMATNGKPTTELTLFHSIRIRLARSSLLRCAA